MVVNSQAKEATELEMKDNIQLKVSDAFPIANLVISHGSCNAVSNIKHICRRLSSQLLDYIQCQVWHTCL